VVIGAELGRKNYGSIFHNCDWERAETIWCQSWSLNQIKQLAKVKKQKSVFVFQTNGATQHMVQKVPWFTTKPLYSMFLFLLFFIIIQCFYTKCLFKFISFCNVIQT
jgi:hypothetical protein